MLSRLAPAARTFATVCGAVVLLVALLTARWQAPGLNQGYAPEQPLPFSHRLHAGELGLDCLFCHSSARRGPQAGFPPTGLCLGCHADVTAPWEVVTEERRLAAAEGRAPRRIVSPAIARLYAAHGLTEELLPRPEGPQLLNWIKVHNLPDFVAFDHSVHVGAGLSCSDCHGAVHSMERVRQTSPLSMGSCLDCHRSRAAPVSPPPPDALHRVGTDCASCHY